MAAIAVAGPSSRGKLNTPLNAIPLQNWATDANNAEKGFPGTSEEMKSQSQIRQRLHSEQPLRSSAENETPSTVENISTTGLSAHDNHPQGILKNSLNLTEDRAVIC
jgi:hypothetical protein